MPKVQSISLVGDYGLDIEPKMDSQRTINFYIRSTPEGKSKAVLSSTPGMKDTGLIFDEYIISRSLYTYKDKLYSVISNKVFLIENPIGETHEAIELGTLNTISGYVPCVGNANQLMWVDGVNGYIYDLSTSSFSQVSAPGFPSNPIDLTFIDGYYIVARGNTNEFFVSALNDGTKWDALNFEGIQSRPDIIVAIRTLHRRIFIFGKISTEIWYNAGAADFPFRRDNNSLLEYGCSAAGSVAVGYQLLIWLAGDENGVGSVMITDGTNPIAISNPQIDYVIQNFSDISDAVGTIYKIDGDVFYELSFTKQNRTFLCNISIKSWTEKQTLNKNRSLVNCHAYCYGKHYVGDYSKAKIYILSSSNYTDLGEAIRRERITGHLSVPNNAKIRLNRLTLDFVAGVGLVGNDKPEYINSSHYDEPNIYLSWSKDGGKWFGNKRQNSLGRIGERNKRALWRSLGASRDWVFKFEIMSKSNIQLLGATVEYNVDER